MIMNRSVFIWSIFYAVFLSFVFFQYIDILGHVRILDMHLIYDLIVNLQKLLFNNTIFFISLLFCTRKEFLNPLLLIRYKKNLSTEIIKHGTYISGFYIFFTFLILLMCSIFIGLEVQIDIYFLVYFFKLFIFCLYSYLVYAFIYLFTSKKVMSLLINMNINFTLLVSYLGIVFYGGIKDDSIIINFYWVSLYITSSLLLGTVYFLANKKEFVN